MSERLTDEQLCELEENADTYTMVHSPAVRLAAAELLALRARVAKLEAALKDTAKQMMSDEMDQDQRDNADWQFGYDACVETARAALSETVEA